MNDFGNINLRKISPSVAPTKKCDVEECSLHKESEYNQDSCLMPKECTQATREYAHFEKPVSMENNIKELRRQGIDFEVSKAESFNNHVLSIKNTHGQIVKVLHYDNGIEAKNLSGYEIMSYKDKTDIPSRVVCYNDINRKKPYCIENNYKNVPQESFTKDKLTCDTSLKDYIKNLEAKGKIKDKDFIVENSTDNDGKTVIDITNLTELDSSGKKYKKTGWLKNNDENVFNSQSYYDKDGFEFKRITLSKDGTTNVCDYYDKENWLVHNEG